MDRAVRNRLLVGLLAMIVVIIVGTLGYWVIGGGRWTLFDCLYMTIITITTVGYTETLEGIDQVPYARAFTIVQLVFGTGVLVYFASTITAFIVEGDLRNVLSAGRLKQRIRRMTDHVIVCGAGSTGRYIIEELIAARVPAVAIDTDEAGLRAIGERHARAPFAYLVGDATDDRVLRDAAVERARGVLAVLPDDKDNLYIVVACRHAGVTARIVARASEVGQLEKLRRVGADGVVAPEHIGSRRMVAEMLRPTVVRFLDDMLRDERAVRFEEVTIGADSSLAGKTLEEAAIFDGFGMYVLAVSAGGDAGWIHNPEATHRLIAGTIVIVLGSVDQVARLRAAG